MDIPQKNTPPIPRPNRLVVFWNNLVREFRKNSKLGLVVLMLVVLAGVAGWAQYGQRIAFQFNRFFAYCDSEYDFDCDDDGYNGVADGGTPALDCDDSNPDIYPGAYDIPGNGVDEDCNGSDATPPPPAPAGCVNPNPLTCDDGDCDDDGHQNPSVGGDDCNDGECSIGGGCPAASSDFDGDYYTPAQGDCNDFDVAVNPGMTEIPGNGKDDDCNPATSDSTGTPAPTTAPAPAPFSWNVTRNDFVQGCEDGPWFLGKTLKLSGHADNPSGSTYHVRSAAFHSNQPGCTRTTDEAGGGISISGKGTYATGESGDFTINVNTTADQQCGRYQYDAVFTDNAGSEIGIMGVVLNFGTACGALAPAPTQGSTPAPTAAPTATPTPTPIPTATPTPTPTPTAVPTTPPPTPVPVACSPTNQSIPAGQVAQMSASGGNGTYSWSGPGGSPSTGSAPSYGPLYANVGSYTATVTSGGQTATCNVTVTQPVSTLSCSPPNQSVVVNQTANLSASGGNGTYSWSSPGGFPLSGSGAAYSVQYGSTGSNTVTVTSGGNSTTCTVSVNAPSTPAPTPTPTTPALSLSKLVRNVTSGSAEADSVSASPNDTVEFSIRVSSVGTGVVRNVRVSDSLPLGLTYLSGTTTVDGVATADGIIGGSISLGDFAPGRTVVVRFRAQVAAESSFGLGTTTLTNTATTTSDNVPSLADTAFVQVVRSSSGGQALQLSIAKLGRNVTRGEFAEQSSVNASPNDTVEFVVHVRSLASSGTITNVIVSDVVPTGMAYIPNTTSVNGIAANDDIVSSGGLNVGSLVPGQQAIIRLSARVNTASALPTGTTTVINTARVRADSIPEIISQLPIVIFNGSIAGISKVPTGAGESVLFALAVSALITLMYMTYTRTEMFKRREIESITKKKGSDEDSMDFKA